MFYATRGRKFFNKPLRPFLFATGIQARFKKFNFWLMFLGGDSQNFLGKFVRFFVTLGLKILRLFILKVLFEADIIKG